MKSFAIIVLCALVVVASAELTPEQREKNQQRAKECQAETGVAPELIEKFKSGQPTDPTPELKV